jgi:predicted permease
MSRPGEGFAAWLGHTGRDVRHAWRSIVGMPVLAAVVVLSLAAGIGVNTTIFSWMQAVVLRPIPGVKDVGDVHLLEPRSETGSYPGASWREYGDLRGRVAALSDLVAFRMVPLNVGRAPRTERVYALLVSENYFSALGVRPALGRFPRPGEAAAAGGEPVVVISHGFWRTRLEGAPDVLGRTVRVNDRDLTVVGVAPSGFQGTVLGLDFDLWVPATFAPVLFPGSRELEDRGQRGYQVLGRLAPDASRGRAQAEVDGAMRELARVHPATNAAVVAEVLPFWRAPRGPQRMLARGLAILQAVMLLLLLAVCGNTATLVLARASTRRREVGMRLALGASPRRVARLLLVESLLLALVGAALGAAVAVWGTTALRALPMIGAVPIRFQTSVDGGGLAFAAFLGVACGVLFGAAPAAQMARVEPLAAMRTGVQGAARSRLRSALMGVQVALASVVLLAAGIFLRDFGAAQVVDPGFRREGVLLAAYDLSGRGLDSTGARRFAARLLERLRATPGVEQAAIASSVPLDIHGLPLRSFTLEGRARSDSAPDQALSNVVTPGYFATMRIPLVAGRDFADLADAAAPRQVIANEEFVRRYVGAGEPLGRRLESRGRTYVLVGVVRNSVYDAFGEPPMPIVYYSYRDRPGAAGEIHVRTRPGRETLSGPTVERVVRDLDAGLPVHDVRTLDEHVDRNLVLKKIPARMFVVLAPLLLVLAAVGVYAVVAFVVSRRATEIGVRIALGGTTGRVVRQVVGGSVGVIVAGAAAGWLLAFLVAIHVRAGRPLDLPVFLGVPAVLLLVAVLACWLPAWRATRAGPAAALR